MSAVKRLSVIDSGRAIVLIASRRLTLIHLAKKSVANRGLELSLSSIDSKIEA